ncbi:polysaccharide deacetylase family sporulation protein PdaB [Abyssisolibacter fermentans]|uniref:polysaccharide deacetylase family sporulation protein PdaB n=1 Tax=Abyssisolibacter fermentans TaxID=1766203 RepID=UPI00082D9620|nr:polysaccharide deacetylase family sporulation protein PdaB [Abyssisolibacter fermentans]
MKIVLLNKKNIIKYIMLFLFVFSAIRWSNIIDDGIDYVFAPKKELPIYCVDKKEKKIAISFDAAWGAEHTLDILDTLDKYNVKTTFFLVKFWAEKYPEMVKEIHKRGHEIGNHSSTHPHMSKLSKEQIIKELKGTENVVKKLTGQKTVVFRPPFGDYNDRLIKTCRELGYYVIQWDVDSLDWKSYGVQPVVDKVTRNVKNGSIVLFHNNSKYVSEFLPLVIQKLQEQGYEIVPVSELIHKGDFRIDSTGKQIKIKTK